MCATSHLLGDLVLFHYVQEVFACQCFVQKLFVITVGVHSITQGRLRRWKCEIRTASWSQTCQVIQNDEVPQDASIDGSAPVCPNGLALADDMHHVVARRTRQKFCINKNSTSGVFVALRKPCRLSHSEPIYSAVGRGAGHRTGQLPLG